MPIILNKIMQRIVKYYYSRFTVSIIGRPNVGKSSLFNKLHAGRDSAIVSPQKGVTRDRKEGFSDLFKVPVRLVDTAGIEELVLKRSSLYSKMLMQTVNAIHHSDLTLFVIDGREGVTQVDMKLARWLKQPYRGETLPTTKSVLDSVIDEPAPYRPDIPQANAKNVLLVANKCENDLALPADLEQKLYRLGLGTPIRVASIDGTGLQDLLSQIEAHIPEDRVEEQKRLRMQRRSNYETIRTKERKEILEYTKANGIELDIISWERDFDLVNRNPSDNSDFDEDSGVSMVGSKIVQEDPGVSSDNLFRAKPIQLSIIGRINMGKSTLVNKLVEQDRVIADSQPGTTRDPISIEWVYKGRKINLIDTAGIETDTNNLTLLQKLVQQRTHYALRYSNVVMLMIDSLGSFRSLDLALAQQVVKEGRGIVIVINKWDLVEKEYRPKIIKYLQRQLDRNLSEVQDCKVHCISAEQGANLNALMDTVVEVHDKWNTRISTGLLNDWLNRFKKLQNLPISEGDRLRIRFVTQIKIRPPTFSLFINDSSLFKLNYLRYLRQSLCKEFGLHGVPIRFALRDQAYQKERKQLEKEHQGKTVKAMFLKRRRLANMAKQKLESLAKGRKKL